MLVGKPNERIEPVHGAREFAANLEEPVAAGDVSEFMRQDDATAFPIRSGAVLSGPFRPAGR